MLMANFTEQTRKHPVAGRRVRLALMVIGIVLALLILVLFLFDWNLLRGPISDAVRSRTGREFAIDGNLDVKLRWTPTISMERVRFANAPWAKQPQMFSAERVVFTIRLGDLLQRRVVIPDLALTRPEVALELAEDGRRSWAMDREGGQKGHSVLPDIERLRLDRGELSFADPGRKTSFVMVVNTDEALDEKLPTRLEVKGTYQGSALQGEGRTGKVLSILDSSTPVPLDVWVRAGDTQAKLVGVINDSRRLQSLDLKLDLKGPDLSRLYPLIPVPLPKTKPYSVRGKLLREGSTWTFSDFAGGVGNSDLSGSLRFEPRNAERPRGMLSGELQSRRLDLGELSGFLGAAPGDAKRAAAQARAPGASASAGKVLPSREYRVGRLQAMDADVKLRAARLERPDALPLDALSAHLRLTDGKAVVSPLVFSAAGGQISGAITLDAREQPIAAAVDLQFKRLQLDQLFPMVKMTKASAGTVGGQVKLKGRGNSVGELLGNADGSIGLVTAGGQISNRLLELAGLDGGELIRLLFTGDKSVRLRCAVAILNVKDGVAGMETFVIDTDDTNIYAEGQVNLAKETLNLKVSPEPKDVSILSARTPLLVRGTFRKPAVMPDPAKVAARGIVTVLLGLINPLLALIPLIETGPGEDQNCGALLAHARQRTNAKPDR